MVQLIKNLISLLNKKEDFLVIEFLPGRLTRFSLVRGDPAGKALTLVKTVAGENSADNFDFFKKSLKRFGNLNKYKIIVSLDSELASTVYSSISLVRNNAKDPIDEADMDNLVSQAVWKFFDRHRARVAQKLGVNDFDVLLTDVRIDGIKLDGHRVINPLGFKARSIEIQLGQTFTTRPLINELRPVLPTANIRFISEGGAAWSRVIGRTHREPKFLLANVFFDKTSTFLTDNHRLSYYDGFDWGESNLIKSLVEELKVDPGISRAILDLYFHKQTSAIFAKKIEKFLLKELHLLANALNSALSRTDTRLVYLHSFFNLPEVIFSGGFKNKFDFSVRLESLGHNFISENLGFTLKFNKKTDSRTAFSIFSVVLEASFAPHYEVMSQLAKRRVRWLSPL